MVLVVKADGKKEEFDRKKIIRTCLQFHLSEDVAEKVASKIEKRLYDGITTKKIYQIVLKYVRKHKPEMRHRADLRHAISLLRPKPDFEEYVRVVLREHGYRVEANRIVSGGCVEHELDGIAEKDGIVHCLEVKHHTEHHSYTGLHVFLEAFAAYEDLVDGGKIGKNSHNFRGLIVVSNTKVSEHAKKYTECKGVKNVCWDYPEDASLRTMINGNKNLYPITIIKELDFYTQTKLADEGIVTLKQLVNANSNDLIKAGVKRDKLMGLVSKARSLLETN